MRFVFVAVFVFLISASGNAQAGFQFETPARKVVVPFKLINNLVFVPIDVNGVTLNFLVDTGVEETILLSLEDKDVSLKNIQKIKLKGLGSDEPIDGLKSSNNILSIQGLVDRHHDLYIVTDESFNFSSHIGIPVNGIIGYNLFRHHVVRIDYGSRRLIVYDEDPKLRPKLRKKYASLPITIERNKPYAIADVTVGAETEQKKLLLDIGNSDALWLFNKKSLRQQVPEKNFEDYLGKGFSGDIYGKRARISDIKISDFTFENPIIAFPDSSSVHGVALVKDRAGSVGGEILRRFDVVLDYPQHMMYLRKNSNFREPFRYNMSGVELQNDGVQWVQETVVLQTAFEDNTFDEHGNKQKFKYKFSLKPLYIVSSIREHSPAEESGLQKGDVVISINGAPAHRFTLEEINAMLKAGEGKSISFEVERNGVAMKFSFRLHDML